METVASRASNSQSSSHIAYQVKRLECPISVPVYYLFLKRLMDLVASIFGLILCFIPMLIIAVLIKLDSTGPVIYKQERLGLNGKAFTLYKFRSMRQDAESSGAKWAEKDDPRVTKIGRFLRNTRLDELPQLINILRGDMSLVGPRPERAFFYKKFEQYIPEFSERLKIVPGLTGLAQISGGYDLRPEEKIVYDMKYMKTRSVFLDVKILLLTVGIIFSHRGAR